MGSLSFSATLYPRGPAAAVVLEPEQVAAIGEGKREETRDRRVAQALDLLREGRTRT